MKDKIKNKYKKINRISRLSDCRRISELTTKWHIGTFEIEVSPKALDNLEKDDKKIQFSLEHDLGIKEWTKEAYRIRINNERSEIKTDFNYLVRWYIKPSQHFWLNDWWIQVILEHIDASTKRWQLRCLVYNIAEEVDRRFGNDCWFTKYETNRASMDFINKKI